MHNLVELIGEVTSAPVLDHQLVYDGKPLYMCKFTIMAKGAVDVYADSAVIPPDISVGETVGIKGTLRTYHTFGANEFEVVAKANEIRQMPFTGMSPVNRAMFTGKLLESPIMEFASDEGSGSRPHVVCRLTRARINGKQNTIIIRASGKQAYGICALSTSDVVSVSGMIIDGMLQVNSVTAQKAESFEHKPQLKTASSDR